MRYTADRQGHKWEESTGQDKFLEKLYGSAAGSHAIHGRPSGA